MRHSCVLPHPFQVNRNGNSGTRDVDYIGPTEPQQPTVSTALRILTTNDAFERDYNVVETHPRSNEGFLDRPETTFHSNPSEVVDPSGADCW